MDETLGERLWGLTEMFPECLRNLTSAVVYGSLSGVKSLYSFTRSASWVFFTTTTILVAPVLFEVERTNLEEVQRQQQRQVCYNTLFNIYIATILFLQVAIFLSKQKCV